MRDNIMVIEYCKQKIFYIITFYVGLQTSETTQHAQHREFKWVILQTYSLTKLLKNYKALTVNDTKILTTRAIRACVATEYATEWDETFS